MLRRALPLLTALLLTLAPAACGSGSSEPTSGAASAVQPPPADTPAAKGDGSDDKREKPKAEADSGGGAKQFEVRGGDNSIQEYGEEQSGSEFAAAAEVLHAYLDARAAGAWDVACEQLAAAVTDELVRQLGAAQGGEKAGCREILVSLTASVPAAALREAARAEVGAFRVSGGSGFLLFRGARGENFFIPMHREDGDWKVAAIAASPLL